MGETTGIVCPDASLPEVLLRRQGHVQALAEAGLQPDPRLDLPVPFEVVAARTALDALLTRAQQPGGVLPDGVVACSDLLALQAVQAVRAAGLRVPQDVAVVGYDDMPLATYSSPPLTTVHQPVDRAGVEIVEALLGQLSGARVPSRTLDVHLVLRDSAP